LIYADSGKILAILPYNLAPNAQYQLLVGRGAAISGPVTVTVGAAQPDILQIDNTGSASVPQNIWNQLLAGTAFESSSAAPATPLSSGQTFTIYCTGLGAIDQSLNPAAAPGKSLIGAVNSVTAMIGSQNLPVTFAGLTPGYPGLYQVTGTVPSGLTAGKNIPLTITVAGQTSAAVKVSVK